jgi:hypothetical protein
MPTKPNRAGQQQNYVPKGNGDASGEYGDNATGSNKHFTAFKQPDKTENKPIDTPNKAVEPPKEEVKANEQKPENKYLGGSKEKSDFSATIYSNGFSLYGEETKELMKKVIANANEESIEVLNFSMMNHPVTFIKDKNPNKGCYFSPTENKINIKVDALTKAYDEPAQALFHELGHYVNENNSISEKEKWYVAKKKLTDARTLFDDNKSVTDTLQEEIKEFSANGYAPLIRKEQRKYMNEKLKPYGFTMQEHDRDIKRYSEIIQTDPEWQARKAKLQRMFEEGQLGSLEQANETLQKELQHWKATCQHRDFFKQFEEHRQHYNRINAEWGKLTGIQAVSDVWSSKSDLGFGWGHPRSYYKKSYYNEHPEELVADELFANFYGAWTVNNKAVLETTKKYFPRTYDKMVKLVEHVKEKRANYIKMGEEIARFQRGEKI